MYCHHFEIIVSVPPECKVKTIFDKNYSGVPSISLPGVSLLTPKQELIQSTTPSDSTTATAAASASQSMSSTTLSVTSPAAMPTSPTAMLASPTALKAEDIDVKLERSEERKLSMSADNQTEEEADDDEGTTLSTEIMQQGKILAIYLINITSAEFVEWEGASSKES